MNIIEIATSILDLLKLIVEIIAIMFLIEPTYMTWLVQLKSPLKLIFEIIAITFLTEPTYMTWLYVSWFVTLI
jgi:hypothetical protein